MKLGGTISATQLHEIFTLGITDPTDATWADDSGNFNPIFAPFDLTNGGAPLRYDQSGTIKQQAAIAAQIYKGFGRWSSVCSAITCWASIAAE